MKKHATLAVFIALFVFGACSHNGVVPAPSTAGGAPPNATAQSVVTRGYFTEYSLPSGIHPSDLTRGPYDTVYFTQPNMPGAPATVWEMVATTGQVDHFTAPGPYQSAGFDAVISLNRSVYYVVKIPINEDEFVFARVTPEGVFSFTGAPYFEFGLLTNLALEPWNTTTFTYGYCIDPCQGPNNGEAAGAELTDFFVPTAITGGPGGFIYAAAREFTPSGAPTDSRVYVISASGTIVHTFSLPNGASPAGIVTGSDHNLWITEPGRNKIARMTPAGVVTEFSVPTANAQPDRITYGYDTAQYFTETNAGKIGRVTTTGSVTEYAIPTAASKPTGIAPCSSQNCGTHGGVWFTETAANKIGRFNAPI
jgi:hypothetical protein